MKLPPIAFVFVACAAALPVSADPQVSQQCVLKRFDVNRDGRLDAAEREQARAHLERQPTSFGRSVARIDESPAQRRQRVMERFDQDGDGRLSPDEAARARESWSTLLERTDAQIASGLRPTPAPSFPGSEPTVAGSGFPSLSRPTSSTAASSSLRSPAGSSSSPTRAGADLPSSSRAPSVASAAPTSAGRSLATPTRGAVTRPSGPDPFYNQRTPPPSAAKAGAGGRGNGAGAAGGGRGGGGGARGMGAPGLGGGRGGARGPLF